MLLCRPLRVLIFLGLVLAAWLPVGIPGSLASSPSPALPGPLHVRGNEVVNASGVPIILRGAQYVASLNVARPGRGDRLADQYMTGATFRVMHDQWHMNLTRLPTSDCLWQQSPQAYLDRLETAVRAANAAGLVIVIDLHEDRRSCIALTQRFKMPTPLALDYWKAVAVRFKDNPAVVFDVYNEPSLRGDPNLPPGAPPGDADWKYWLHGGTLGGETHVGMQSLVDAIRSEGTRQLVVVESLQNGFTTLGSNRIDDSDVLYSYHEYFVGKSRTPAEWDRRSGGISDQVPMYVGEWAFQVNSPYPSRCRGLDHNRAIEMVREWMAYLQVHRIWWTVWKFNPPSLTTNYESFTPTTLAPPWQCGSSMPGLGDGELVKAYLTSVQ